MIVCGVGVALMLGGACSEPGPVTDSAIGSAGASVWPPLSDVSPDEVTQEPNPWMDGWGGATGAPTSIDSLPQGAGGSLSSAEGGERDFLAPQETWPPAPVAPQEDETGDGDDDQGTSEGQAPSTPRLLLRGYREGSGNDKLLTLEYLTSGDAASCVLEVYSNGNTTPWRSLPIPARAEEQDVSTVTLCTKAAPESPCDGLFSSSPYNGNDALVLSCDGTVIDSLGRVGEDPGEAWLSPTDPLLTTRDVDLVRCGEVADVDPTDRVVLDGTWASTRSPFADPCKPDGSLGAGGSGPDLGEESLTEEAR